MQFKVIKFNFCSSLTLCLQLDFQDIFTGFVHTRVRLSQAVSFMDTGILVLQSVLTGCPACDIRELLWVKPTQQKAKSEGSICRAGHACCQSHPSRSQNICVCL